MRSSQTPPAPWARSAFATALHPPWPFYCEENALRAALAWARDHPDRPEPAIVFIFNRAGAVRFDAQRAAPPGLPLLWDYHVVLLADGHIHDPDCRAGVRRPALAWLAASFPDFMIGVHTGPAHRSSGRPPPGALDPLPLHPPQAALAPTFRAVQLSEALAHFSSDRRHMRSPDGAWQQPPPPWPAPTPSAAGAPHSLPRLLDPDDALAGAPLDLARFQARFSVLVAVQ